MLRIVEQVQLTDTTTSYRITQDHIDLEETLDQSYERHRAASQEQARSAEDSTVKSTDTTLPAPVVTKP